MELDRDKLLELFSNAKDSTIEALNWGINNPEKVAAGLALLTGFLNATKHLTVSHRNSIEQRKRDLTYYDPATGFHWELKRKPTNNDRAIIQSRRRCGEDTYEILRSLRLI